MAEKEKKQKAPPVELTDIQEYALDFDAIVDSVHKEVDVMPIALNRADFVVNATSTCCLVLDLIIGGGWHYGKWVVLFGVEGSGKSSVCYNSLKSAVSLGIPVIFMDYETSTDPDYLSRILGVPLDTLFGKKDEDGNYITKPMVRYEQPETAEKGFRLIHRILKALPNKIEEDGKYYFVYDPKTTGKDGKAKENDIEAKLKASGQRYVKDDNGKFRTEAKNGLPQVIFFVDSFIAMFPEARDDDDEKSSMAQVARVFSENAAMIKNRLGNKRACIIGTNQLRLRPGAYGNPEYEPGGEAIKFFSDVRVKTKTIAVPNGTGHVEEEPCWDGDGIDRYRYVNLSVPKNKVFSPFRQSNIRFWFEEKGSPGRGIDPVFDCFQYLEETGQVSGKGRYTITLEGLWTNKLWTWKEFKKLILNPNRLESYVEFGLVDPELDTLIAEFKGCGGVNPYVVYEDKNVNKLAKALRRTLDTKLDIHAACRAQIADSSAFKMYFNTAGKVKKIVVSDASKICSACRHWKVDKACKKMKAEDSCKEWEAPPPPEVKKEKKAKVEEADPEMEIPVGKKKKSMNLEV